MTNNELPQKWSNLWFEQRGEFLVLHPNGSLAEFEEYLAEKGMYFRDLD